MRIASFLGLMTFSLITTAVFALDQDGETSFESFPHIVCNAPELQVKLTLTQNVDAFGVAAATLDGDSFSSPMVLRCVFGSSAWRCEEKYLSTSSSRFSADIYERPDGVVGTLGLRIDSNSTNPSSQTYQMNREWGPRGRGY